jgi:hypothetical protein
MKCKDVICVTCHNKFFGGSTAMYCSIYCRPRYQKIKRNTLPIAKRFIGYLSEIKIAADLTSKEYELFWPVSIANSCDLIALKDNKLFRIQVKTVHRDTNGKITIPQVDVLKYDILALFVDNSELLYFDTTNKPFYF